jgi:hypothetical protein
VWQKAWRQLRVAGLKRKEQSGQRISRAPKHPLPPSPPQSNRKLAGYFNHSSNNELSTTTTLRSPCCQSRTSPLLITASPILHMCYMQTLHSSDPPLQHSLILAAPSCAPARLQSRLRRRPLLKLSITAHTDFFCRNDDAVHTLYQSQYTSALQGTLRVLKFHIGARVNRKPSSPDTRSRLGILPLREQVQLGT